MPTVCARSSIAALIPTILRIQRRRSVDICFIKSSPAVVAVRQLARINLSAFIAPVKFG
jgi:hypothetical protein